MSNQNDKLHPTIREFKEAAQLFLKQDSEIGSRIKESDLGTFALSIKIGLELARTKDAQTQADTARAYGYESFSDLVRNYNNAVTHYKPTFRGKLVSEIVERVSESA